MNLDDTISLYENNSQFKIDDFGQAILTVDGQQMLFAFYDSKSKCIYKFEETLVKLSKDSCIDISRYITRKIMNKEHLIDNIKGNRCYSSVKKVD